jgi:predicted 3-demethylubiquinone-9 3-methyltransferase (glyoxalase superfamily)
MSGESIQNMFEEEREEDDEAWIDQFDNSKMIYDEEREEYNRDEPSDSKDKWEKIGLKLEGYSLCAIEAHTLATQDMEVPKDEGKSESTMSDRDVLWYTGDKESNIQDFENEDLVDKEDFKEEMNAYIIEGLHVPHDELKKL